MSLGREEGRNDAFIDMDIRVTTARNRELYFRYCRTTCLADMFHFRALIRPQRRGHVGIIFSSCLNQES